MSQAKVSDDGSAGRFDPDHAEAELAEDEALARAAWRSMYQLFRSEEFQAQGSAAAAALELTDQQMFVLLGLPLDDETGLAMRELAEACHTTPSYLTSVVDTLEGRGFVRRHPDPDDRRVTRIRLTTDGKGAVYHAQFLLGTPPTGLRDLPLEDLRTLASILGRAAEGYPWP